MQRSETSEANPASDANDTTGGPTIYYDGSCPLCTVEIDHYATRKGGDRLDFIDVTAADAELGSDLAPRDAKRRFHVRLADGTLVSGARGFVAIWRTLPGWKWLARIADIPGVTPLLELAYRGFLPIRPTLSKIAYTFGARASNPSSSAR